MQHDCNFELKKAPDPFFAFFTLIIGFALWTGSSFADQPLNVLFIAVDDLRTDLACYGHPMVKTPNLDRLAARGTLFERAYCQQALCNPSRASVMTGLSLDTLRLWDLKTHFREVLPGVVTLPEHFKNQGYFTQNIGKIYHNWLQQLQGDPQSWSVPAVMHFATHGSDLPEVLGDLPVSSSDDPKCECRDVSDEAYFDGRVAQLAIQALNELARESRPFFLAVGFWKPHSPFNAPKQYWDLYSRAEIELPPNKNWPSSTPRIAWHNSREILGEGVNAREVTEEAAMEIRHGYLANISYVDAQIGKVLDRLDHLNLTEKTIVVFWSDHGYHLGERTLWAKTSNFELDARVPLIIAVPEMKEFPRRPRNQEPNSSNKKTEALVELIDLFPTLVELCGLDRVEQCEGKSLTNILFGKVGTARKSALTQHPRPAYYQGLPDVMGYSIRTEMYRYTEWRDWQTGETIERELYDHSVDVDEMENRVTDKRYQNQLDEHAYLLRKRKPLVAPGWRQSDR